jgi:Cytochrome oxidase c subunit VIb
LTGTGFGALVTRIENAEKQKVSSRQKKSPVNHFSPNPRLTIPFAATLSANPYRLTRDLPRIPTKNRPFQSTMVYGLEWLTGPPQPKVEPVRAKSADGGYVAPDRSSRERCYESRDCFFECLDKHDILDANKHDAESRQKCPKEVADYERDCAKSWVSCGIFWIHDAKARCLWK